jgi:MEKHLA domain
MLTPEIIAHTQILLDSFRHFLGKELIPRTTFQADALQLFLAPCIVVSHATQADPILNYGNQAALELWEASFDQLTRMPSRLTAEPVHRYERAQLLERTTKYGFVNDYQGIRITTTGKRFRIHAAIVWNLIDANFQHVGQAATFTDYTYLPE